MRILKLSAIILILLLITGLIITQLAWPEPNLEEVPNPITDKAQRDWAKLESMIPTNPKKNLYFGDLHVHSSYSFDAWLAGNYTFPFDAYSFAKGNSIEVLGEATQLKRPLDFTAVTDHSEFLGEMYSMHNEESEVHNALLLIYLRYLRKRIKNDQSMGKFFGRVVNNPVSEPEHFAIFEGYETTMIIWEEMIKAAEAHYEPGVFTTFAAYEWTYGLASHIHRNVIFRDMKVPAYPMSSFEAKDERAFWESLQVYTDHGATVLAIPHNSNLSGGEMFKTTKVDGTPIDLSDAQLRQTFERLVEVHQNKGNSEVYADFWKNDEFSDFENYYEGELYPSNFVRDALKKGLEYEEKLGVNPFKYGMIGSTDTHNSTPGKTEENSENLGQFGYADALPEVRSTEDWAISNDEQPEKVYSAVNPGGLVAVWAEANTRGHIYDAMERRETYATSGGRIQLRFFGGFEFEEAYKGLEEMLEAGYTKGVAMGGDLLNSPVNNRPLTFLVWASKDPEGANLDRIQMIKGWYEAGKLKEKIFQISLSDGRVLKADGSVPDNEATVNLETGAWDQSKGDVELSAVWRDPEFNPKVRAFYYVRVLEIPSARWNLWDEIKYGVRYPEEVPKTIRERAWSSPIWYIPE